MSSSSKSHSLTGNSQNDYHSDVSSWTDLIKMRDALNSNNICINGLEFSHPPPQQSSASSSQVPTEILELILSKVGVENIFTINQVCRAWKTVTIGIPFWKRVLEDSGLSLGLIPNNLLTNKNIWILFYAMTKNQILTKTYIQNPCGDEGLLAQWKIEKNGGNGINVETIPIACDELPEDKNFPNSTSCFITSYHMSVISQEVDLNGDGLTPQVIKLIAPFEIGFSVMAGTRGRVDERHYFFGARGQFVVQFMNEHGSILASREASINTKSGANWQLVSFGILVTRDLLALRKVKVSLSGCDKNFWAGHYGLKISRAALRINFISNFDEEYINNRFYSERITEEDSFTLVVKKTLLPSRN